ncbi:PRP38 family protein [Abeliophyllum distichum]|uniref:Pre-mRNA-splicing factor 38 n=1 Tax=Abeliophyllum distichum TaxID=126358 RepID=A0ABD1SEB4_9LAMI
MSEIKTSGRPVDQLLEKVLCMNILSSDYFRDLLRLKTYHEVIDEIYVTATHVEPWMTGNCRGPSTAFCLLYKFFTMKLTVKQMHGLLKHPDSPYIRAIGFLYLRYVADPKTLWSWYEPYLKDDEEFSPGSNGRMTTIGVYVRDLLLGQYYFDTLLPRIPVPVLRTVVTNLENMKLPTKHCGVTGDSTRGSEETSRRPPSVKASLSVSFGQRAPHRASTRDSSPVRRTLPPSSYDRENNSRQSPSFRRSQSRTEAWTEAGIGIGIFPMTKMEMATKKEAGTEMETWHRERNRERGRDGRYDYDRRSRDSYRRDSDNRSSRDDRYHRDGSYRRSRSRSRIDSMNEPSGRNQHHPSPTKDGNKEKTSASSNLATLRDLYGDFNSQKAGNDKGPSKPSGTEEVIKLGGSTWR